MKKLVLMAAAFVMQGCITNAPCPERLGFPKGAECHVLIIPTPSDPLTDTMQAAGTLKKVFGSEKGENYVLQEKK